MKQGLIGKYILESISIGLYNNPLMIFREYIQNSVDSIDSLNKKSIQCELGTIEITIDGRNRKIIIKDNGTGVSKDSVFNTMCSIGKSEKQPNINRGFRGIGRLGGLGYCDELSFITKASGESYYSTVKWDSIKMEKLLNDRSEKLDAAEIVETTVEYFDEKYEGSTEDHFFIVEMKNVRSLKDILLDVPLVKSYISQAAPVPFNSAEFKFAEELDSFLCRRVNNYGTYEITVNGEKIYKPYKDAFSVNSKNTDYIQGIDYYSFKCHGAELAFAWLARTRLLGSIKTSNNFEGIRVRSGNILVGDKSLLAQYFREERFNNYIIGEIYITCDKMILNSRRDDFEDTQLKDEFIKCFIKDIGIPYSRLIREASVLRSSNKQNRNRQALINQAKEIIENGFLSQSQKKDIIKELINIRNIEKTDEIEIEHVITKIDQALHFLEHNNGHHDQATISNLKQVCDIIYDISVDKNIAEKIIKAVLQSYEYN